MPLLTNYTAQANALGMAAKFYYTVREVSTRAPETFAFLAQQGEIFVSQDPYPQVQPGYAQDWNTHGGSAYLHQHVVSNYAACWQAAVSTGEWDPSLCDRGVSRFFNYYLEGLYWSFSQPPYINGIYYDGCNFPRLSLMRIRRVADAAATSRGSGFPALLDLHSGRDPTPPATSYASHYPLMDYVWNGEGFDFNAGAAYWLVETSSQIHGLTGDMLGSQSIHAFKGMLFGMTERNSGLAEALWDFWDHVGINETTPVGWWETQPLAVLSHNCTDSVARPELAVVSTVYTKHASHAIVVVSSFCPSPTTVSISLDWSKLGLNPDAITAELPAIAGMQAGKEDVDVESTFALAGDKNLGAGIILVIKASKVIEVQI